MQLNYIPKDYLEMLNALKSRAQKLKQETFALYFAYRDPRTPWFAKAWALAVLAYALSPIDLIPDFIPVLGYLDDIILVPAGIALAIKLIPAGVMADAREISKQVKGSANRVGMGGAAIIITLWVLSLIAIASIILRFIKFH
jgi:uncharacterized membrane protein YkvA (DUF1232 family)